ncbi:hypothetical protein [Falsihalocynthiibacter arcticus]|uniref:HEPN AbiU2-like domain-containing protein n=1 Tax=Falsihalocynthiibacter arcticus TaxID=1579316 RepID=A0A126UV84_9RHOB|nr:hypothetical protein [Falsihalocynthiibacter arcticus]AML49982.1 hypothetical protein RC74_00625 [Falsihalocynthiibacter arcticus]
MTSFTPAEVRANLVNKLGKEHGEAYYYVSNSFINLKIKWRFFQNFFVGSPERVELLNNVLPIFFHVVEKSLFREVILGICRLLDPIKNGRNDNLSLLQWFEFLPDGSDKEDMRRRIAALEKTAIGCRRLRNKVLAHSDLNVAVNAEQIDGVTSEEIIAALREIEDTFCFFTRVFLETDSDWDALLPLEDEFRVLKRRA